MAISKPITEQTVEEYKKQYAVNGMLTLQRFLYPYVANQQYSRWRVLLCQVLWPGIQEARIRQPDHHLKYLCSHCERSCRSAGEYSLCDTLQVQIVSNISRYTTQRKPPLTTLARVLLANGGSLPESTSSHRASSTPRWVRLLVSSTRRPE